MFKDYEEIYKFAILFNSIDQNKLYIMSFFAAIIIILYSIKFYLAYKDNKRAKLEINELTSSLSNINNTMVKHELASADRINKLVNVMEEIRDRQKQIISKSDSIRIIINKFNDVIKREVINIFEWSFKHNDYHSRKDFVRRKVKSALAEVLWIAKESLSEFNLSIDLSRVFIIYKNKSDNNIHLQLVDQLWKEVEPIYEKKDIEDKEKIIEQQIEEMKIVVGNIITAELAKIQMEVNNIYK